MATETKTLKEVGKAGEVSTSPKAMQKAKPDPDVITANQAARAKLSPELQSIVDKALLREVKQWDAGEVQRLLKAGADPNVRDYEERPALMLAVARGHTEIVKLLLDYGAELYDQIHGHSALRLAGLEGDAETAELLIDAGADINERDEKGRTELIFAVSCGHIEMAKLLIASGADLNAKDERGRTALMHASRRKAIRIAKLLKAAGAEESIRGDQNEN